jgi:molybdopterin/thiamine biosynthesis adenylyltransferase
VRTLRYVELQDAKILLIGAGGPGAAVAAHLAAAGAGYIAVADGGSDDGFNRAEILGARLAVLQPDLQVDPYPVVVEEANAVAIATGHDVMVDATGDAAVGRLVARAGAELGIPVVHLARGTVLVTRPGETACFGCTRETGDRRRETALRRQTADGSPQTTDLPAAERSLLAGLVGAAAAADVAAVIGSAPLEEAVLRTVSLPAAIEARSIVRDPSCAVCAVVTEGAR